MKVPWPFSEDFFFLVGSVLSIENGFNVEEIKKKYYRFNHNELDIILICFCLTAKISQNRFFVFVGVATAAMAAAAAAVAIEKWSERVFPSFVFFVSLSLVSSNTIGLVHFDVAVVASRRQESN